MNLWTDICLEVKLALLHLMDQFTSEVNPMGDEEFLDKKNTGGGSQVFADLDYCGKRFGDNRCFQYTAEKGPVRLAV